MDSSQSDLDSKSGIELSVAGGSGVKKRGRPKKVVLPVNSVITDFAVKSESVDSGASSDSSLTTPKVEESVVTAKSAKGRSKKVVSDIVLVVKPEPDQSKPAVKKTKVKPEKNKVKPESASAQASTRPKRSAGKNATENMRKIFGADEEEDDYDEGLSVSNVDELETNGDWTDSKSSTESESSNNGDGDKIDETKLERRAIAAQRNPNTRVRRVRVQGSGQVEPVTLIPRQRMNAEELEALSAESTFCLQIDGHPLIAFCRNFNINLLDASNELFTAPGQILKAGERSFDNIFVSFYKHGIRVALQEKDVFFGYQQMNNLFYFNHDRKVLLFTLDKHNYFRLLSEIGSSADPGTNHFRVCVMLTNDLTDENETVLLNAFKAEKVLGDRREPNLSQRQLALCSAIKLLDYWGKRMLFQMGLCDEPPPEN